MPYNIYMVLYKYYLIQIEKHETWLAYFSFYFDKTF